MGLLQDDLAVGYNLACTMFGIGSLRYGYFFAASGPFYGAAAIVCVALVHIYATRCLSYALLKAPLHVQTYGDLGHFVFGNTGRYVVLAAQFGTCLMIPIVFLIMGGGLLLPRVFRSVYSAENANVYILLMAASLIPFVLNRGLKEGAVVAVLGVGGTILGDLFYVTDALWYAPYFKNAATEPTAFNVMSAFSSMSLAYGVGLYLPSLQRKHPAPERLPKVIAIVITAVSLCYMLLGLVGYAQNGCVTNGNFLHLNNSNLTIAAYGAFYIHSIVTMAVILNPAFFIFERYFLGTPLRKERSSTESMSESSLNGELSSHYFKDLEYPDQLRDAYYSDVSDLEFDASTRSSSFIRILVIVIMALLAILLQDSFDAVGEFVGGTCLTFSCVVLPLLIYWLMYRKKLHYAESLFCITLIIVFSICGCFTGYINIQTMIRKIIESGRFGVKEIKNKALVYSYGYCANTPTPFL